MNDKIDLAVKFDADTDKVVEAVQQAMDKLTCTYSCSWWVENLAYANIYMRVISAPDVIVPPRVVLSNISVNDMFQRQGYVSALIAKLKTLCTRIGYMLMVENVLNPQLQQYLEKEGFRIHSGCIGCYSMSWTSTPKDEQSNNFTYRKLPVQIEAFQYNGSTGCEGSGEPEWFYHYVCNDVVIDKGDHLIIRTLEGDHRADVGDYIIKGVKGELYPCKSDIFEMTYTKC